MYYRSVTFEQDNSPPMNCMERVDYFIISENIENLTGLITQEIMTAMKCLMFYVIYVHGVNLPKRKLVF